jgi:hypothetical protein
MRPCDKGFSFGVCIYLTTQFRFSERLLAINQPRNNHDIGRHCTKFLEWKPGHCENLGNHTMVRLAKEVVRWGRPIPSHCFSQGIYPSMMSCKSSRSKNGNRVLQVMFTKYRLCHYYRYSQGGLIAFIVSNIAFVYIKINNKMKIIKHVGFTSTLLAYSLLNQLVTYISYLPTEYL